MCLTCRASGFAPVNQACGDWFNSLHVWWAELCTLIVSHYISVCFPPALVCQKFSVTPAIKLPSAWHILTSKMSSHNSATHRPENTYVFIKFSVLSAPLEFLNVRVDPIVVVEDVMYLSQPFLSSFLLCRQTSLCPACSFTYLSPQLPT